MEKFNAYSVTMEEVTKRAGSGTQGLTSEEAEKRLQHNGPNALAEQKKKSFLVKFFEQFKDMMIIVLLCAAALSAVLAIVNDEMAELLDSGIILLIVVVNAIIGLVQDSRAEAAMEALKKLNKPYAKVLRDGNIKNVPSDSVVVGDIIILEAGDTVAADIRLIESISLKIEESALTGESVPSEKNADAAVVENAPLGDRVNMAYSGCAVTYGRGRGIVVACGMDTEVGKIAAMLSGEDNQTSPLQNQLARTAKLLSILVLGIAVVIFGVNIIRATVNGSINVEVVINALMTAVAIAVAAIPEGLPATVTIVLAIGVQKMAKKNAIIKNLPSVETLGCCEIICSDKTGTLTLNRMTVKRLYRFGSEKDASEAIADPTFDTAVRTFALCNDTNESNENGTSTLYGDPTETALVKYLIDRGESYSALKTEWKRIDELPFDSVRKLMSVLCENDKTREIYVKGAPDLLLARCNRVLTEQGIRPITEDDRAEILAHNHDMAGQALRVLCAAVRPEIPDSKKDFEQDLVFVGLVGMIDPPRPEVRDAVAVCKTAGMRPLMITGDHKDTAAAIAREIGILEEGQKVITGAEIDRLSDKEFSDCITDYSVFARVSPENKVRIVKAYQAHGKIVAMTGDGVNDAPSIKAADIGIGMGITGTEVSKGAADMVLADDNFATIVSAVEEGRKIYANIKKAMQFLLSANIAEVLCLFIVSVFLGKSFLTPIMILWINLVTDSLPALALGTELAESDVMRHRPRKVGGSLFASNTGVDILVQGVMQTILVMVSYFIGEYIWKNHEIGVTMAFVSLAFIQLFHAYNLRSAENSILGRHILSNLFLNIAFVVGAALMAIVMFVPKVPELFGAMHLNGGQWLIALGCAILIIPVVEIRKFIRKQIKKRKNIED